MSKLYKHIGHFLLRGRKKPIVNHFRHRKPIRDAFRGYLSMQFSRFTFPDVTFSLVPPLVKCFIRFHQAAIIGNFMKFPFDYLHQTYIPAMVIDYQ